MNKEIDNILSFVKGKKLEVGTFLVMYHLDENNKVIIDTAKPTKNADSTFIFFQEFKNPYEPTEKELMDALMEFLNNQ